MGLRRVTNRITPNLNRKRNRLQKIVPQAHKFFQQVTPIDTGNARRKTDSKVTPKGGQIIGDYPYAVRLNDGYSKQAPQGMAKPTIAEIKKLVKRVL